MASPLIYRRRLINAINAPGHHIVYIYGPAGFGKTVLAKDWMQSQELPTAWVEGFSTSNAQELLDIFLNEIALKMPHLEKSLSELKNIKRVGLEHIAKLSEILESDKTPFNIIIENAEEIRRSHNELSMAIVRKMPKHIKLILVTATSPRSDFIKEAGVTRFAVVGPEDLRFNQEEIKLMAQNVLPGISNQDVRLIHELTEGWPASAEIVFSLLKDNPGFRTQLSTLKLKGKQYFALEANRVLAKLEDEQRTLLMMLSPLQYITPEIAFNLTNNVDVVRQLTLLSQDSVIVSQLDQLPPKFKIHPIFREVLLDELRRDQKFNIHIEKVVDALLESKDIRQATSILIEIGETLRLSGILQDEEILNSINASLQDAILRSAINELRDWIQVSEYFPADGSKGKSILRFYANLLSGDFRAADTDLKILEGEIADLPKVRSKSWQLELLALKSLISYGKGRIDDNWEFALATYEIKRNEPESRPGHQLTYLHVALWGAFVTDNDERIIKIAEILDELNRSSHPQFRQSEIAAMRCLIAAHQGRLRETQNYLVTPVTGLSHSEFSGFFGPFGVRFAEATLAGEFGQLEESVNLLGQNAQDAIAAHNYPIAVASLGRLAYHLTLLRKSEEGLSSIENARELIRSQMLSDEMSSIVDMWEIRVRHFMIDNERVQELIKRCKPSYFVNSFKAAAAIYNENFENAKKLMSTFNLEFPRQAVTFYLFNAYLLKDSPAAQLRQIAKAVEIGSKHGYFYHFITQRSDILQQYISLASEFPTAFNERLAKAAGEELNKMMIAKGDSGEALTKREADILRHLATGLPLKDIAQNLNISKNTIKTHLRNLYRKLGAEDRNDAVEKGKKLLKV